MIVKSFDQAARVLERFECNTERNANETFEYCKDHEMALCVQIKDDNDEEVIREANWKYDDETEEGSWEE